MSDKTQYTDVTTKKLDGAQHEIRATIPAEVFENYYAKALKKLGEDVEVPGFRKGNVPENMLEEHVGESQVLQRAANTALSDVYPKIVADEGIDAIGSPQIQITKLAKDNPLEFTATTAVMPDITLPDYQQIAKDIFSKEDDDPGEVTDAEVNDVITHVRRQRAQIEDYEKQKSEGVVEPQLADFSQTDESELPELTDEFVKTLGEFNSIDEFKAKVHDNVKEEKRLRQREKKRVETVEKIIEESKIELPELMVDQELQRIQMQMESEVAQTGTKLEDYLANVGKTLDELKQEWRPEAEKRAKLQLILNKIATEQSLEPDAEEVQKEIKRIKEHYPQAEEENIRIYVETTKRNEMVFQWLEEQASK